MVDKVSLHLTSTQSLRASFKNLSSGTKVPAKSADDAASVKDNSNAASSQRVSHLLNHLNNAVNHSSEALASLKKVQELSRPDDVINVKELAKGLDNLRGDIGVVLGALKSRAETADVMHENLASAEAKIADVEAAKEHADDTGVNIKFDSDQAIEAHGNLDPESVANLLKE